VLAPPRLNRSRGNNHGAIELYEQLGFREWGRQPNVI
jgi:ribosomal protein S18 acetylase RimI-like enzyme